MKLASTWFSSTEILIKCPKTKSELNIIKREVRATKYQKKGRSPRSIKREARVNQPTDQPTDQPTCGVNPMTARLRNSFQPSRFSRKMVWPTSTP